MRAASLATSLVLVPAACTGGAASTSPPSTTPVTTPIAPPLNPVPSTAPAATDAAPTATPPPEHRIGVRVVGGQGEFFDRLTGETFVVRGANYVFLQDAGGAWGNEPFKPPGSKRPLPHQRRSGGRRRRLLGRLHDRHRR